MAEVITKAYSFGGGIIVDTIDTLAENSAVNIELVEGAINCLVQAQNASNVIVANSTYTAQFVAGVYNAKGICTAKPKVVFTAIGGAFAGKVIICVFK